MYTFLKNNNFDKNAISAKYNEVKVGKSYKILNAKKKGTIFYAWNYFSTWKFGGLLGVHPLHAVNWKTTRFHFQA